MTKQHQSNNLKIIGNENSNQYKEEKRNDIHQKSEQIKSKEIESNVKQNIEDGRGTEEKIPRNAFLKLDLDAIALRMKKDLADRCCCADVPCVSIVKEYCESSSLHGFRYITEDGRHWSERVLWVLLCSLGFYFTIHFIYPIWSKWETQPTLTSLDSTNYPVWEIDFPAVTVCSPNKVSKSRMEALSNVSPLKDALKIANITPSSNDLETFFKIIVRMGKESPMGLDLDHSYANLFEINNDRLKTSKITYWKDKASRIKTLFENLGHTNIIDLMKGVMPNCTNFFHKCWWKGEMEDCAKIFDIRRTDDGFCCSFNSLEQSANFDLSDLPQNVPDTGFSRQNDDEYDQGDSELSDSDPNKNESLTVLERKKRGFQEEIQQGFHCTNQEIFSSLGIELADNRCNSTSTYVEPVYKLRRLNSASYRRGLSVLLNTKSEDYYVTSDDFIGFKVLVHNPQAYPEMNGKGVVIESGKENFISVSASHTKGSAVRDLAAETRGCLFSDERNIPGSEVTLFKTYSEENCLLECRAKELFKKCSCLPYYYPRLDLLFAAKYSQKHSSDSYRFMSKNTRETHKNHNVNDIDTNNKTEDEFLDSMGGAHTYNANKTCDWNGLLCLVNSSGILDSITPTGWDGSQKTHLNGAECQCRPSCSKTGYSTTMSSARFPNKASKFYDVSVDNGIERLPLDSEEPNIRSKNRPLADSTLIHVFYSDLKVFKYNTQQLYSYYEILASFGGLIGLCTGFSFLSLAEIFYFFTLRCMLPICRKRKKGNQARKQVNTTDSTTELVVVQIDE